MIMLKSHEKFHSSNGKRQILIAEDEMINREILGEMLKDEYELLYAHDGNQALDMVRANFDTLSLILLDIMMPGKSGIEVLREVKEDEHLSKIPVIVMTAEKDTEIESLKLGAIDFIPKPYPEAGVIRARVQRTIELSEDREIIMSTERDELTGLYNRDYFYRYAEQYDQFHKDANMDAVVIDINHFRMINERYGKAYGDEVLRTIGDELRNAVAESGGIVCRRNADTFMAYCPHREDYPELLDKASSAITDEDAAENRVRLRLGVYNNVDKSIDIERRFDRAKMAADTVRGSVTKTIGVYDDNLHKKELYAEQLIEDFSAAIADHQFKVFYQPKFDIRPDTPVLASAEALVRWDHPELGMVSPGVFIPLFEDNGLIQKLDMYIWRETARQVREWKDRLNYSIPVSVNVSRIDMLDPGLPQEIHLILDDYGLTGKDIMLEVTESAYTQDSDKIIEMVETLRSMGMQIEMDDFGTGYSSLNMISNLPIDALKLDIQFIRNAFREGGNTHMLEVIIGISDFLGVPVIAEGVETAEQLRALKALGCDIVQGYFFSRPVPAADFEAFILQKKELEAAELEKANRPVKKERFAIDKGDDLQKNLDKIRSAREADAGPEEGDAAAAAAIVPPEKSSLQLKTASIVSVILAVIAAIALMAADFAVSQGYQRMEHAGDSHIAAQQAATDMELCSDYLTDRVRCFVTTGEIQYLQDYYEEVEVTKRRDKAVEELTELINADGHIAITSLSSALDLSNELVSVENRAIKLVVEAGDYDEEEIPDTIKELKLSKADAELSPEEKRQKALELVFDSNYMHYKERIRENVNLSTQALIISSSDELEQASAQLSTLVSIQTASSIAFLLIVLGFVIIITLMVRQPLTRMVMMMQNQEVIPPTGVEELRFVTRTYNNILEENRIARERLSREASHDALTGLFNRGAYDLLIESADTEHMALILIDVDNFKGINDEYGHAVGDRILKRVADTLRHSFRSVDILCRIGGDEFAVVMTRVDSSLKNLVVNKINQMNEALQRPKDDLPPVSLSVGVAFADRENPQGDIFRDADTALYRVKRAGRNGCQVF